MLGRYGMGADGRAMTAIEAKQKTEQARVTAAARTERARIEATTKGTWAKWAPLIILGGVVAVGAIVLGLRRRKRGAS